MNFIMVGNPNSGKSAVMQRLFGVSTLVANYPGTSVEISKYPVQFGPHRLFIYDTPGIYSIFSDSPEANHIRELLEPGKTDLVINVLDATNLARNLALTLELQELGAEVLVVVNLVDEARQMGIEVDLNDLSRQLNCPVVGFSALSGEGKEKLTAWLESYLQHVTAGSKDAGCLTGCRGCGGCGDNSIGAAPGGVEHQDLDRWEKARRIAGVVTRQEGEGRRNGLDFIQAILDRPVSGTVVLLLLAYAGFYFLVKFIEFSEGPVARALEPFNTWLASAIAGLLPVGFVNQVLSQAVPEGLIIPFSIIMPAMLAVNLIISLLEDTGLLPRYSVALERVGSLFGVSGQAVIPLSMGFGCRTPAVLATRILPSYGERFIVVTLLSIVIPCAATVGIMASVISAFNASLGVLISAMIITLVVLGVILRKLYPGTRNEIYELPPLRIPDWRNVAQKVKQRFAGFFTEVLPLLLLMSIGVRALIESGVLELVTGIEGLTRLAFGIPAQAFVAVLITIVQRYLAPLVLLNLALTPREATIAIAMIALSLPCLPVMVMTVRELGGKELAKILGLGLATSFSVGIILNLILPY